MLVGLREVVAAEALAKYKRRSSVATTDEPLPGDIALLGLQNPPTFLSFLEIQK